MRERNRPEKRASLFEPVSRAQRRKYIDHSMKKIAKRLGIAPQQTISEKPEPKAKRPAAGREMASSLIILLIRKKKGIAIIAETRAIDTLMAVNVGSILSKGARIRRK